MTVELLEKLCMLNGASGDENRVRDFILSEISGYCEYRVDPLGNIIAEKKGKYASSKKISAHMDEVGMIVLRLNLTER